MIKTGRSYSVIGKSTLFKSIIINKLMEDNHSAGYFLGVNMFGKHIVISDTLNPSPHRIVLSKVKKEGFDVINLEDTDQFIYAFEYTEARQIGRREINKVQHGDIDELYYKLGLDAREGGFTYTKLVNIVSFTFGSMSSALIKDNMKVILSLNHGLLSKITASLLDDTGHQYLGSSNKELTKSPDYIKNMMKLSSCLLNSDTIEETLLHLQTKLH